MLWLLGMVALWGMVPSLPASLEFKDFFRQKLGEGFSFLGLRQFFEKESPANLVTSGFYCYVRHIRYIFGLFILWLSPSMTRNSLIASIALTAYIFIGIVYEERKLLHEFGTDYAHYQLTTPRLLPGVKWGGNK